VRKKFFSKAFAGFQKFCRKKFYLNLYASLAMIFLFGCCVTIFLFSLQFNGAEKIWLCMTRSNFLLFWLNCLPVLLPTLFIFFATGSASLSCCVTGSAALALGLINRYKIAFRRDALMPWDYRLASEFLGIARSMGKDFYLAMFQKIALALTLLAALLFFVRTRKFRPQARLWGALAAAGLSLAANFTLLSDRDLYAALPVAGNQYNVVDNYDSKGFLYSFLYHFNSTSVRQPPGYNPRRLAAEVSARQGGEARAQGGPFPHVLMILSEAFSDLPMAPALSYEGFADPLAHYKQILQEASLAGHIVTPGFGGGTADTEFDIFTGVNTRHFRGVPYSFNLINRPAASLARVLAGLGYGNFALHPGYGWFYNRQNVYPLLGFSRFTDVSVFTDTTRQRGMYVDETYTMDTYLAAFQEHLAQQPDTPLLAFLITIQNHGPYPGKYQAAKNFHSQIPLAPQDEEELANYIDGLLDVDRELGRLTDFLRDLDEPVVVLYFGDHRPALRPDLFHTLLPEAANSPTLLFEAPFVLWQNPAAQAQGPLRAPDTAETVSAAYLGGLLLEALGLGDADPYFSFLNEARRKFPVVLEGEYLSGGTWVPYQPGAEPSLDVLMDWEYDRIK
jgi:phosphoglycerol transferase MdoB-like AlkP superfamily enzyme